MSESRFAIIPADAIDDLSLTAMDLRVLGVIAYHADRDRSAWPKQATIAARLKITRGAVNRCIGRLKTRGYIEVEAQSRKDGGQRENVYFVPLDPKLASQQIGARSRRETQAAPPPCNPRVTPPVTAAVTPIEEQTIRTKPPNPLKGERRAAALEDLDPLTVSAFEIVWSSWPAKGLERSASKALCLQAFTRATAKAAPEALKIAAAAYLAKTKPAYAVGLNKWLKLGQWENFLPTPQAVKRQEARQLAKVTGKAGDCLEAIVQRWGEAKARAWLADAVWTDAFCVLPSDFQALQVRNLFQPILDLYGFSVRATGDAAA